MEARKIGKRKRTIKKTKTRRKVGQEVRGKNGKREYRKNVKKGMMVRKKKG